MDALAQQIYTKGSANYHHFLSPQQYAEKFGPTAAEAAKVQDYLKSLGLNVTKIHANNFFVQAQGTVSRVQSAFGVKINRYSMKGRTYMSNAGDPVVFGEAGNLIKAVTGLHDLHPLPNSRRAKHPDTGEQFAAYPLAIAPNGSFWEGQCFKGVETHAFTTSGHLPAAVYTGYRYGSEPSDPVPHLNPCGYQPSEIQTAYGMNAAYAAGYDGTGMPVVIVDAFMSPSIASDVATFSGFFGLPAPSLTILTPPDQSPPPFNNGWAEEITLDVEWAHAIAPGSPLVLIEAQDNSFDALYGAIIYAVDNGLGGVISNSWSAPEALLDPGTLDAINGIDQYAALNGVSLHFASGDSGDDLAAWGVKTVENSADSQWATGIGGTSLFLNPNNTRRFETGWGNNETRIANVTPNTPVIPPLHLGYIFGAGGGTSGYFAKPFFQSGLPGAFRMVPDISMDADPETGVEMIWSFDGNGNPAGPFIGVIGGTSASCPMFSGLWAVASQAHGAPLGFSAPYLYGLPPGAVYDVPAGVFPFDVAGVIMTGGPPLYQSPASLAAPLNGTTNYLSMMYHGSSTRWYVLTFGTDSSLKTGPGWDNVTGVGTPNGLAFINAVK